MKNKKISPEEWVQIKVWRAEGKTYQELANLSGRPKSTIQYVISGVRPQKKKKADPYISKYNFVELEEMELSSLSDEVLFKHDRSLIY